MKSLEEQIEAALRKANAKTPEEAQSVVNEVMRASNRAPVDDFHGLTPEEMGALLYAPFDSPGVLQVPTRIENEPSAIVVTLLTSMLKGIGDGVRATAKMQNLPRTVVVTAADALIARSDGQYPVYRKVRNETDFLELHGVRIAAELGGLIQLKSGRFTLTDKCRQLQDDGGIAALYPALLKSWAREFSWAYLDGYDEMPTIQQGALFSLYLLSRYGGEFRPADFYADAFSKAFPMVLEETQDSRFDSAADQARRAYRLRTFDRFAVLFGLAESRGEWEKTEYRATPLLADAVRFAVPISGTVN